MPQCSVAHFRLGVSGASYELNPSDCLPIAQRLPPLYFRYADLWAVGRVNSGDDVAALPQRQIYYAVRTIGTRRQDAMTHWRGGLETATLGMVNRVARQKVAAEGPRRPRTPRG